ARAAWRTADGPGRSDRPRPTSAGRDGRDRRGRGAPETSSRRGPISRKRRAGSIHWARRDVDGSVNSPSEPADRAGRDLGARIADEVAGAAVRAAVGAAGGMGAAPHAAHRHGPTGHRSGGGARHHVWFVVPYWLARLRVPAISVAHWHSSRRCGLDGPLSDGSVSGAGAVVISWPGASGERVGAPGDAAAGDTGIMPCGSGRVK